MKAFLLAGQSNMQGYGPIDGFPVLYDPRVFNLATGNPEPAEEPLHYWPEHPYKTGLGLAMPFALEVLKAFPAWQIGFIPAARGGSCLDQWLPEHENFERAVWLYERARQNNPGLELAGILWHQGEADAGSVTTASDYGRRLLLTLNGFRQRLAAPAVPVVTGELGYFLADYPQGQEFAVINRQLKQLPAELENSATVSSQGLQSRGDNIHFDTVSVRTLGVRYAQAYLALLGQ